MIRPSERAYVGGELDIFSHAVNWKRYVKETIREHLTGDVLEVGAGIGSTTVAMHDGTADRWLCLEPDFANAKRMMRLLFNRWGKRRPYVIAGSLQAVVQRPSFDCVLYMDVLEHIFDDRDEIEAAARRVRQGGHIIILSPAHQWLFSAFDESIGHLRRYNKAQLGSLMPAGWVPIKMAYIDSVGVLLSLGNLLALGKAIPSARQIAFWDRFCIPLSRVLDSVLKGHCGKSVLAVWRKPTPL